VAKIIQTADGGYLLGGFTNSTDGDIVGKHSNCDIWVAKLDNVGSITWQRCLGGSDMDAGATVLQNSSGEYIIGGETGSNDKDISGNHGGTDTAIFKL
jgi:hypothetical protein